MTRSSSVAFSRIPLVSKHITRTTTNKRTQAPKRHFSQPIDNQNAIVDDGIDTFTKSEMAKRHQGIIMNQKGISQFILPGDQMVKTNQKTGQKKMVAIERSVGYFWYIKDLKDTDSKPVMANDELIPVEDAQVFPPLNGLNDGSLKTLEGVEEALPHFFTKDNRSNDPSAMCTLVGVNFNEYGNQMLPSWMEPFEHAFRHGNDRNRVKTSWLSINEGRTLNLLKYFITKSSQNNVPDERKGRTLLYFGACPDFRDVLRMHNDKTAYVFLVDGVGRVRFAGSGKATDEELKTLVGLVHDLTPGLKSTGGSRSETLSRKKSDGKSSKG